MYTSDWIINFWASFTTHWKLMLCPTIPKLEFSMSWEWDSHINFSTFFYSSSRQKYCPFSTQSSKILDLQWACETLCFSDALCTSFFFFHIHILSSGNHKVWVLSHVLLKIAANVACFLINIPSASYTWHWTIHLPAVEQRQDEDKWRDEGIHSQLLSIILQTILSLANLAWVWPVVAPVEETQHRSQTRPSLSPPWAISAFALSSAEPKTGTSHRWSLRFIGSDTQLLP